MNKMTQFKELIEKHFPGLNYLSVSLQNLAPGDIINHHDEKIDALHRLFPAHRADSWKVKKIKADVAGGTIMQERKLEVGANLFNVMSVETGIDRGYSASFEFGQTFAVVFDTRNGGVYEKEVKGMMRALRNTVDDSPKWSNILNQFVVMECIYIDSVTVEFKKENRIIADVDIPVIQQGLKINGEYLWEADGKLIVRNNTTPFAVRGFVVQKTI